MSVREATFVLATVASAMHPSWPNWALRLATGLGGSVPPDATFDEHRPSTRPSLEPDTMIQSARRGRRACYGTERPFLRGDHGRHRSRPPDLPTTGTDIVLDVDVHRSAVASCSPLARSLSPPVAATRVSVSSSQGWPATTALVPRLSRWEMVIPGTSRMPVSPLGTVEPRCCSEWPERTLTAKIVDRVEQGPSFPSNSRPTSGARHRRQSCYWDFPIPRWTLSGQYTIILDGGNPDGKQRSGVKRPEDRAESRYPVSSCLHS